MPTNKEAHERAIREVLAERELQDQKWGPPPFRGRPDYKWLTILVEEVGEAAEAILELPYNGSINEVRNEVVQIAAVALAWLEDSYIRRTNA